MGGVGTENEETGTGAVHLLDPDHLSIRLFSSGSTKFPYPLYQTFSRGLSCMRAAMRASIAGRRVSNGASFIFLVDGVYPTSNVLRTGQSHPFRLILFFVASVSRIFRPPRAPLNVK